MQASKKYGLSSVYVCINNDLEYLFLLSNVTFQLSTNRQFAFVRHKQGKADRQIIIPIHGKRVCGKTCCIYISHQIIRCDVGTD